MQPKINKIKINKCIKKKRVLLLQEETVAAIVMECCWDAVHKNHKPVAPDKNETKMKDAER